MTTKVSLRSLFESNKGELKQKLNGFSLPKDAEKIQQIISDNLNHLLEADGTFRQNLTQSEEYILQATLRILTIQEKFTSNLVSSQQPATMLKDENTSSSQLYSTLIGTGAGVLAGAGVGALTSIAAIWGPIVGALAGNAIAAYIISRKPIQAENGNETIIDQPIDIASFMDIITKLCESVDGVIETYRAQVNRIIKEYENREKPSFQEEYAPLLEQIVQVNKVAISVKENLPQSLAQAIEMMVESLENFGLKIEGNQIVNI